jgi:hypothetical protein
MWPSTVRTDRVSRAANVAVGQTLAEQHHDLAFSIGQRQGLAGLTKRGGIGVAALCAQRFCSGDGCQRRTTQILTAIRHGRVCGRIHRRHQIAYLLETS